jgi:multimeric flavodoxin WrbA
MKSVCSFQTEFIDLADKELKPCLSCNKRYEIPNGGSPWKGEKPPFGCIIKNDYIAKVLNRKLAEADGLIIGTSVCALTPSITFRIFSERQVEAVFRGHTARKPIANIAVAYGNDYGQETCLNIMNAVNNWGEYIPVGWPHGTVARGGCSIVGESTETIEVKDDVRATSLSILNAQRVAQWALMNKLAEQELGNSYKREFYMCMHAPHGDESWEWHKLDLEDEDYMNNLTVQVLADVGK